MSQAKSSIPRQFLVWTLILAPLLLYLSYLPRFGYLQNNDYYTVLHSVLDGEQFSRDPMVWIGVKANEHLALFPSLIYAANALLNHGNNRALTLFTLTLMAWVFTMLYRRLPEAEREDPGLRIFFGLSLSAFAFTPVAAHNVAMGFSGTQWFLANALSMTAVALFTTRGAAAGAGDWRSWFTLYGTLLVLGVVGVFSYTTSLCVWPALLLGVFWLGLSWRHLVGLVVCGLFCVGLFLWFYETLAYHPEHNTRDWLGLAKYMAVYFGSPFTENLRLAKVLALLGALTAGALHLGVLRGPLRDQRRLLAPWLMVQVYALGSALGTAVGRSNFGQEQALASRYATLPGLFWAALFVSLGLLALRSRPSAFGGRRLMALFLAGLLWLVLLGSTFIRGLGVMDSFAARASRQQVTTLMLLRGYGETELLRLTLTSYPRGVWLVHDALKAMGHVPFDRTLPEPEPRQIERARLQPTRPPELQGYWQNLYPVEETPEKVRVRGWAYGEGRRVEDVVLADDAGKVHGELIVGIERPWVAKTSGVRPTGWEGYVTREALLSGLTAYARWEGDPAWYPLKRGGKLDDELEELRNSRTDKTVISE